MIKIKYNKPKTPVAFDNKNYLFPKPIALWIAKNFCEETSVTSDLRRACDALKVTDAVFKECILAAILDGATQSNRFDLNFTYIKSKHKKPFINEYNIEDIETVITKQEVKKYFGSLDKLNKEVLLYLDECINYRYS
jgi:hypothetical protein